MTKSEFIKWIQDWILTFEGAKMGTYDEGSLDAYKVCLVKAKQLEEPKK